MGVIGAVMVIRQLAESSTAFDMNRTVVSQHSTSVSGLSTTRKKKASHSFSLTPATMHSVEMEMSKQLLSTKESFPLHGLMLAEINDLMFKNM